MRALRAAVGAVLSLVAVVLLSGSAQSSTFIRQGLEKLTSDDERVLVGRVLETRSYWNADHSFIFTDVRVSPQQVLKGDASLDDVTFTLMGGSVGDLTTLVVDGPELIPGSDYVLFLKHEDLPGERHRLTIGSLEQGVFDVSDSPGGRRAVSQAAHGALLADPAGIADPPGGTDGLSLDDMIDQVRRLAGDR